MSRPSNALHRKPVLISHPAFSQRGFGDHHPLSIMRHEAFLRVCASLGWLDGRDIREAPLADRELLARFHCTSYLDALETSARTRIVQPEIRARYNLGSMECPVFEGLWERVCATVGGSIFAADLALEGYLPFHPGGGTHHGRPDRASGFCYSNDPVYAILRLLDAGLEGVLYIDLDAHHGDGVESTFAEDPRVHLVSFHEEGRWPRSGTLKDAHGPRTINVPLPRNINDSEYLYVFQEVSKRRLRGREFDAVVITCGADILSGDPLTSTNVSNAALAAAVTACIKLSGRAILLGGGGYNPWNTARLWAKLWADLNDFAIPAILPQSTTDILASLSCDLIDESDFNSAWLTTLSDPSRPGGIRAVCRARVVEACPPPDLRASSSAR
ncbi:MAG: acetoin utilization protein AcuC [Proteobacteria bacterium]|nr:acetoin utilization protein AcuC [Pseudomonadota bacterium]